MTKIRKLMTPEEMEELYNARQLEAAEICRMKYIRVYQAVKHGAEICEHDVQASSCALCHKHDGCLHCGIYIETGSECSEKGSHWRNVTDAIDLFFAEKSYSGRIDKIRRGVLLGAIREMVIMLNDVIENDSDEEDEEYEEGEYETCVNCGESLEVDSDSINWYDGDAYCDSCFDEDFTTCDECGKSCPKDDAIWANNMMWCGSCHNNNYMDCCVCGESIKCGDQYEFDEEDYCQDCYLEKVTCCDKCSSDCLRDESHYVGRRTLCQDCYEEKYTECEECGDELEKSEAVKVDGCSYCDYCHDKLFKEEEEPEEEEEEPEHIPVPL
jgi:hypothetical protein